jgi:ferric-dicitrate binding protein FerR (iron transport regulator)
VKALRTQVGFALLLCCGAVAGMCAAYDVAPQDIFRSLLRASVFRSAERGFRSAKVTTVSAGNVLSVDRGAVTIRSLSPDEVAQRLAWAGIHPEDGWITFQGETLASVAAVFNQHNARQLVIRDAATARLRVGGKFRRTDVEGFLAALRVTHGVRTIEPPADAQPGEVIVLAGRQ